MTMISHIGDTEWIEPTLRQIKEVLEVPQAPKPSEECGYCKYLARIKQMQA